MKRMHKIAVGVLVVVAAALGGALAPNLFGAGAATATTTTTTTTTTFASSSNEAGSHEAGESAAREAAENNRTASFGRDGHGTAAHENAETTVTGDAAGKAKAAALKSVGTGTAGVVTSDRTGDGYEVIVAEADGSSVEVHLDSTFAVRDGHHG